VYDYVIVGAGSAGCVLALRLTENPATSVLLLEAGPPDDADEIHIPAALNLLFQSTYDWDFRTVPQERAAGRAIYWPRGRMLGGSSSMNAMIYIRGNRNDYDTWRDDYGCSGWGYTDLIPYFRRAEGNTRGTDAYHGGTGPLSVSDLAYQSATTKAWVAAARDCGLPANDDFNGAQQDGSGFYQVTQKDGRRWSTADAYLRPAMARPNLEVKTDVRVTKVVVEGGRAAGVRYLARGTEETAYVQGEVVLSAGAVGSPQLLMLSGIGPADHLRDVGIGVTVDSPGVGANLSDHPVVPAIWRTPKVTALWEQAGRCAIPARLPRTSPSPAGSAGAGPRCPRPTCSGMPCPPRSWTRAWPTRKSGGSRCSSRWSRLAAGGGSGCAVPTRGTSPRSTRPTYRTARTSSPWWKGSGWRASSRWRARWPRSAPRNWPRAPACTPTPRCVSGSGVT